MVRGAAMTLHNDLPYIGEILLCGYAVGKRTLMKERVYCVTVALNHVCVTALLSAVSKLLLFYISPMSKTVF